MDVAKGLGKEDEEISNALPSTPIKDMMRKEEKWTTRRKKRKKKKEDKQEEEEEEKTIFDGAKFVVCAVHPSLHSFILHFLFSLLSSLLSFLSSCQLLRKHCPSDWERSPKITSIRYIYIYIYIHTHKYISHICISHRQASHILSTFFFFLFVCLFIFFSFSLCVIHRFPHIYESFIYMCVYLYLYMCEYIYIYIWSI